MAVFLFPVLTIFAVLFFTQIILLFISRIGGWNTIASVFPGKPFLSGKTWSFQSFRINSWCGYNNIVTITGNAEGLQLSMPTFFQAGHEPIFIPWADMTILQESSFFGLMEVVRIEFKKCPSHVLLIPKRRFEEIRNACREISI